MSTGCEFYGDALVDLARDELEPGRRERVQAHLATCGACRADLAVIRAVQGSPAPVPEGLDARIRRAVAERKADGAEPAADPGVESATGPRPVVTQRSQSPWSGWKVWAVPAMAAAALTLWVGGTLVLPTGTPEPRQPTDLATEYDPYGVWPASDGVVAGEVVLSELTIEELEALLEELES